MARGGKAKETHRGHGGGNGNGNGNGIANGNGSNSDENGSSGNGTGSNGHGNGGSSSSSLGSPPRSPGFTSTELVNKMDKISLKQPKLHYIAAERPSPGNLGSSINLYANYFEMRMRSQNQIISQYDVSIVHPSVLRKLTRDEKRIIFWECLKTNKDNLTAAGPISPFSFVFDSEKIMFTTEELDNKMVKMKVSISLERDQRKLTDCEVHLQFASRLVLDLSQTKAKEEKSEIFTTPLQVINLILRQQLSCPVLTVSKNWYPWQSSLFRQVDVTKPNDQLTPSDKAFYPVELGEGCVLWTGMFLSAITGSEYRPMLNIDVTFKPFYKPQLLLQFICDVLNAKMGAGGRGPPRGPPKYRGELFNESTDFSMDEKRVISLALRNLRVRSNHRDDRKVHLCTGLADGTSLSIKFTVGEGDEARELSVAEYFAERYRPLRYPRLLCAAIGRGKHLSYMPLEMLDVATPEVFGKQTENMTASIIRHAAAPADQRMQRILALAKEADWGRDKFMTNFGLEVNTSMTKLVGRVLPVPIVKYANNQTVRPERGEWKTDRTKFLKPAKIEHYSIISLVGTRDNNTIKEFFEVMMRKAGDLGMTVNAVPDLVVYAQRPDQISMHVDNIADQYRSNGMTCDIIFVIFGGRSADFYGQVKRKSEVISGIMTQCLLLKTVSKPSPATCSNVLMKVNTKLDGRNYELASEPITAELTKNTLFLGLDVTHPTRDDSAGFPSIASLIGSLDDSMMKYGASIKIQRHARESVVYMQDIVKQRLIAYFENTNTKPERIILFRDGVDDGSFRQVLSEEINGIRTACESLSVNSASKYAPKLSVIICQKRHHVRLFPGNLSDAVGRAKNIPPGTVVDSKIIGPHAFEFFLCSHAGIQGTSRPTKYIVLSDDIKMTQNFAQKLIFDMCHVFVRCPRSVGIPAPVYYAHLMALRSRYYIKAYHAGRGEEDGGSTVTGLMVNAQGSSSAGQNETSVDDSSSLQVAVTALRDMQRRMYFV